MSDLDNKIQIIKNTIKSYPDFPKTGILFRDIFPVLQNPEVFTILREVLTKVAKTIEPPVECVVGVDARGFLLGPLIALDLKVPFVPIRKKSKLPGKVNSVSYALEYGEDFLEIQEGSVQKGQVVLLVDDLLATGGSLGAACKLVAGLGGTIGACLVVIELVDLNGKDKVPAPVVSLVKY